MIFLFSHSPECNNWELGIGNWYHSQPEIFGVRTRDLVNRHNLKPSLFRCFHSRGI